MIVYEDAISEIFEIAKSSISTKSQAIVGYTPIIYWPGSTNASPDESKFWFRVRQNTVLEQQTTLRTGVKRYTSYGIVFIQLFCPKRPDSILKGRKLARLIRDSYRQASGGSVVYRNHRIQEEVPDNAIQQFTIIVNYEFDEEL